MNTQTCISRYVFRTLIFLTSHGLSASCGNAVITPNIVPPNFQVQTFSLPPQFTDIDVVCSTSTNALCATTLNVTDNTIVLDATTAGEYTNLNDYNFLRANRSIFPTFDNELVLTPTFVNGIGTNGNRFGIAVAISGDGSTVAISSNAARLAPPRFQRVDIYRRQGNTWVAFQQLFPPADTDILQQIENAYFS